MRKPKRFPISVKHSKLSFICQIILTLIISAKIALGGRQQAIRQPLSSLGRFWDYSSTVRRLKQSPYILEANRFSLNHVTSRPPWVDLTDAVAGIVVPRLAPRNTMVASSNGAWIPYSADQPSILSPSLLNLGPQDLRARTSSILSASLFSLNRRSDSVFNLPDLVKANVPGAAVAKTVMEDIARDARRRKQLAQQKEISVENSQRLSAASFSRSRLTSHAHRKDRKPARRVQTKPPSQNIAGFIRRSIGNNFDVARLLQINSPASFVKAGKNYLADLARCQQQLQRSAYFGSIYRHWYMRHLNLSSLAIAKLTKLNSNFSLDFILDHAVSAFVSASKTPVGHSSSASNKSNGLECFMFPTKTTDLTVIALLLTTPMVKSPLLIGSALIIPVQVSRTQARILATKTSIETTAAVRSRSQGALAASRFGFSNVSGTNQISPPSGIPRFRRATSAERQNLRMFHDRWNRSRYLHKTYEFWYKTKMKLTNTEIAQFTRYNTSVSLDDVLEKGELFISTGNPKVTRERGRKSVRSRRQENEGGSANGEGSEKSGAEKEKSVENGVRYRHPKILDPEYEEPDILVVFVESPVILSPYIFGPYILSPLILSPHILSPSVLSPEIVKADVLSPFILSPQVLNPEVLDPSVLSPHILSPEVLGPYILSPLVLSPCILGPDLLGGLYLTPRALSPDILCPKILAPDVLSPEVLSPSDTELTDILSPIVP